MRANKCPKNAVFEGFYWNLLFRPSSPRLRYVFYESTHKNKCFKIKTGWNWVELDMGRLWKPLFSPTLKNEKLPYNVPGPSKVAEMVSIRFRMIENTGKSFSIIIFGNTKIEKLAISPLKIKFHRKYSKCSSAPSRDRIV